MDAFDVLTNKGDELVAQRDKTANEGERALLNKQIKAIRMAQFKLISNEVIEIIKPQIPQIVADAIKAAGLEKRITGLKTNAEKMEMHKQSGARLRMSTSHRMLSLWRRLRNVWVAVSPRNSVAILMEWIVRQVLT